MVHEIRIHIMFGDKALRGAMTAGLLAALSAPLGSESITLTTYYPAPVGIYQKMTTTGPTVLARDGGSVGVGTTTPAPSALIDMQSTRQGLRPPQMTLAQRDAIAAPAEGLTIYDRTTKQLEFYDGAIWKSLGGGNARSALYNMLDRPVRTTFTNDSGRNRLVVVTALPGTRHALRMNGVIVSQCVSPVTGANGYGPCTVIGLVPPGGTYDDPSFGGFSSWAEYDF